jgi:O-antigen/teichoic acid export membrane protein
MSSIKKEAKHLISLLEKWTELDVLYFMKGGAWLFSTQFILIIAGLLLSITFARVTSKDMFGQFQFILAVLGTLSVFSLPGTNTAVMLGVAKGKDGSLFKGAWLKFRWSILGAVGLVIAALYFYLLKEPRYSDIWPALLVLAVFFPLLYSFDVGQIFFSAKKKFSTNCLFLLLIDAGSAVAAIIVLLLSGSLFWTVVAYVGVQAVFTLVAFWQASLNSKNRNSDADMPSYSFHLTVVNAIPQVRSYFDKLVVSYVLGFAATAVYSIASAMAEQLYAVSKSVGVIVFPKLAERRADVLGRAVKKRTGLLLLFFAVIAGIASLLAPILIPLFFSEQYASAVPIAQILLLITIPRAAGFVIAKVFEVKKQQKKLYFVNLVYAGAEILLLTVLVPLYGLYGILFAKAASNIIYFVGAWKNLN